MTDKMAFRLLLAFSFCLRSYCLQFLKYLWPLRFERISAWEVLLWPDSVAAYLLMQGKLPVGLLNSCPDIIGVFHQQDGMHNRPLIFPH